MASVLDRIPGLGGYEAAVNANQARTVGNLQQAQTVLGIQDAMQRRQQEAAFRAELAAAPDDETRLRVIQKYASPDRQAGLIEEQRKAAQPRVLSPGAQLVDNSGRVIHTAPTAPPRATAEIIQLQEYLANPDLPQERRGPIERRVQMLLERAGSEPLHPIIGPDGKPTLAPRSQAVGKTPYSPSIAGAGAFSEEALTSVAEQYLAGDRQAIQGFARNATARIALQNRIAQLAKERGWKGDDIAAQMADFAGILSGSRTVGQRAAQIELASNEAEKMIDIVLEQSKAFERTRFVPLNQALRAFETQTGQPEVKAFGMAINSLVNVYARAISPSGVPTVSDKEHAREILAQADSPEQVQAVMRVMRQEMQAARSAPVDVRAATRRAVKERTPTQEAPAGGWSDDKEKRYQELLRKRGGS